MIRLHSRRVWDLQEAEFFIPGNVPPKDKAPFEEFGGTEESNALGEGVH